MLLHKDYKLCGNFQFVRDVEERRDQVKSNPRETRCVKIWKRINLDTFGKQLKAISLKIAEGHESKKIWSSVSNLRCSFYATDRGANRMRMMACNLDFSMAIDIVRLTPSAHKLKIIIPASGLTIESIHTIIIPARKGKNASIQQ